MLLHENIETKCDPVSSLMSYLEKTLGTEVHAEITTQIRATKSQGFGLYQEVPEEKNI